jgi:hypothetical protein
VSAVALHWVDYMAQRESLPRVVRPTGAPTAERRAVDRPDPSTSGRCCFCGSRDTYSIAPETFHEWALERWGDSALIRCHDCGRRQAISGLAASVGGEWRMSQGVMKVLGWAVMLGGALLLLLFLLRRVEQAPSGDAPFRVPRDRPASPNAPAPNPSSGPLSLRSTPTNAA